MNIKLDHYRVFFAVAVNLSFSAAAKELYTTQSAVSQSIKALEVSLGTQLFIRGKKGISLTSEGQMLFTYVGNALALFDVAETQIKKMHLLEGGELRIGVGDTISRYYLLPILEKFHQLCPGVRLKILNRVSRETIELLKSGVIDIAFVNLPLTDDSIEIHNSIEIHDIFVSSPTFPDSDAEIISLEDIAKLPLIMLEQESNSRNYVEAYFLSNGILLKPEIELGSHDLLLDFAKSNLGVSCVVEEFAIGALEKGELIKLNLPSPIPSRNIGICKRKSATVPPSAQFFLKLLLQD